MKGLFKQNNKKEKKKNYRKGKSRGAELRKKRKTESRKQLGSFMKIYMPQAKHVICAQISTHKKTRINKLM